MPHEITIRGLKLNILTKEQYDILDRLGLIKPDEMYSVEGGNVDIDLTYDTKPTQHSPNLLTSGTIFDAFEDAEPEGLSNLELEALFSNFK